MELLKEEPQMSIKTPPFSQSLSSALVMKKKKTPLTNRSDNLQSIYLQQLLSIACPLEEDNSNMLISTAIITQPQSSAPTGGAGPSGGGPGGGRPEGGRPGRGPPGSGGGTPGGGGNAHTVAQPEGKPMGDYQQFLKEITWKLRVSSENSPPTS